MVYRFTTAIHEICLSPNILWFSFCIKIGSFMQGIQPRNQSYHKLWNCLFTAAPNIQWFHFCAKNLNFAQGTWPLMTSWITKLHSQIFWNLPRTKIRVWHKAYWLTDSHPYQLMHFQVFSTPFIRNRKDIFQWTSWLTQNQLPVLHWINASTFTNSSFPDFLQHRLM